MNNTFYLDKTALEQFGDNNNDVFTFKIICSKEDKEEVLLWIRGSKEKVLRAARYLKTHSHVYEHIDIVMVSENVNNVFTINYTDETNPPEDGHETIDEVDKDAETNSNADSEESDARKEEEKKQAEEVDDENNDGT